MTIAARNIKTVDGERVTTLEPMTTEPPRPLFRATAAAEPFPVAALGPDLAPAAEAVMDITQASPAICANSVLAVASLAVQAHYDVRLPTGQSRPTSLFVMTIAASGERKTSADREALAGVRDRERILRTAHPDAVARHKNALDAWEAARAEVIKANKGDRATIEAALNMLGREPVGPKKPILTVSEPTVEGLIKLLSDLHRTIGLFSSEGGSFIGGHAMTDEAKLRSAARLSALWDGEPIDRVRSAGDASVLVGQRVAVHIMVQPDAAMRFIADPTLRDQGLLSRVLITAPEPSGGSRLFREASEVSRRVIAQLAARVHDLLRSLRDDPLMTDLPTLVLDGEARQLFVRWHDDVERALTARFDAIRGFAAKLPEHAVRIAAVLSGFAGASGLITGEAMASAIRLADFYAGEAIRLADSAKISDKLRSAERLLAWLRQRPTDHIHLAEIYQRGPGDLRDKAAAMNAVTTLEEHGWVRRIEGGMEIENQHRHDVWRIVREA